MKHNLMTVLCALLFITLSFTACQKEEITPTNSRIESRGAVNCSSGLTTTYPTSVVCLGENFTLSTIASCGRYKIQEKTSNASCDSETGWTDLNGGFSCTGGLYSYTTTMPRPAGVYTFRTVHLQNVSGQCSIPACSGFSGEQYCCFTVTVAPCGCDNSFTAECGTTDATCTGRDNTITFTYVAGDAGNVVIQGGLNANATDICTSSSKGNVVPFGNENNADVRRLVVDVVECEVVTVNVSWNGPGNTGSWSAKLNGTAVGGNLETGYLSAQNCTD